MKRAGGFEMPIHSRRMTSYELVGGKVRVSEQFHTFYPGTPNRNVVGGREKCLHANQTTQRPFRDANDECQPTGAGRGAQVWPS